jgi:organic radical activating enzyme
MKSTIRRFAVEHSLVDHCNLSCAGCDHASPARPVRFSSVELFRQDVEALSRVLRVQTLKLTGGEPLLHPQLLQFLLISKRARLAERVEIWTNGLLLHRLSPDILDRVDCVHISRYPGIKIALSESEMERLSNRHSVRFEVVWKNRYMMAALKQPELNIYVRHRSSTNQMMMKQSSLNRAAALPPVPEGLGGRGRTGRSAPIPGEEFASEMPQVDLWKTIAAARVGRDAAPRHPRQD